MEKKDAKTAASQALARIIEAREEAKKTIVEILKSHNNFISFIDADKTPIYALKCYDDVSMTPEYSNSIIYGIRYNADEDALLLCTEECRANFEWDEDVEFEGSATEFLEEDMTYYNRMLQDEVYFEDFDEDYFIKSNTLIAILAGIEEYL